MLCYSASFAPPSPHRNSLLFLYSFRCCRCTVLRNAAFCKWMCANASTSSICLHFETIKQSLIFVQIPFHIQNEMLQDGFLLIADIHFLFIYPSIANVQLNRVQQGTHPGEGGILINRSFTFRYKFQSLKHTCAHHMKRKRSPTYIELVLSFSFGHLKSTEYQKFDVGWWIVLVIDVWRKTHNLSFVKCIVQFCFNQCFVFWIHTYTFQSSS